MLGVHPGCRKVTLQSRDFPRVDGIRASHTEHKPVMLIKAPDCYDLRSIQNTCTALWEKFPGIPSTGIPGS